MQNFLNRIYVIREKVYRLIFVEDYQSKNGQLISLFEEVRAVNKELFNDSDLDKELSSIGDPYLLKKKNWNYRRGNLLRILGYLRNRILLRMDKEIQSNSKGKRKVSIVQSKDKEKEALYFLNNASKYLKGSKKYYKDNELGQSIYNSISSIEYSLKCIMISVLGKYSQTHDFQDETSLHLIREISNSIRGKFLKEQLVMRSFFITHFWSKSYEYSKYGGEFGKADEVYTNKEVELSISHSEEILILSKEVFNFIFGQKGQI